MDLILADRLNRCSPERGEIFAGGARSARFPQLPEGSSSHGDRSLQNQPVVGLILHLDETQVADE